MTASTLHVCACGSRTFEAAICRDGTGKVVGCFIRLDADSQAIPGCIPDERTNEVLKRRRFLEQPNRTVFNWTRINVLAHGALIHCACGRTTRVLTSTVLGDIDPQPDPAPIDPSTPIVARACWLAWDDSGPMPGCMPDDRTREVLERAGRYVPPPPIEMDETLVLTQTERTFEAEPKNELSLFDLAS